jgi:5-enolpyruvylshikimate-3-phosphate synthase
MDEFLSIDKLPQGIVALPPSKSIAHRAAICAGLADGESIIKNVGTSEDVQATVRCLKALGKPCEFFDNILTVQKSDELPKENTVMDCGESGSTLRFLLPVALIYDIPLRLTGSQWRTDYARERHIVRAGAYQSGQIPFQRFGQLPIRNGPFVRTAASER